MKIVKVIKNVRNEVNRTTLSTVNHIQTNEKAGYYEVRTSRVYGEQLGVVLLPVILKTTFGCLGAHCRNRIASSQVNILSGRNFHFLGVTALPSTSFPVEFFGQKIYFEAKRLIDYSKTLRNYIALKVIHAPSFN